MDEFSTYRNKLIKISLLVAIFAFILSMSVMITYASKKTIIITEDEETEAESSNLTQTSKWMINTKNLTDKKIDGLKIALPASVSYSDVEYSMRYDLCEFTVKVKNTKESYFLSNPPYGSYEYVESASGSFDGTDTYISFTLNELCFADVSISYGNGNMFIKFAPLSKEDKPIVIVDPGHGGYSAGTKVGEISEKDVVLEIARKVEDLSLDKPYRVLLTRGFDEAMNTEERISVVNTCKADYYVGLMLLSDVDDVKKFGMSASYNPDFYHNDLENATFSDLLLKNMAIEASDRALGINEASSDELILKVLDIPATILYAGYMSNADEIELLKKDNYIEKIAQGIINGLDEAVKTE